MFRVAQLAEAAAVDQACMCSPHVVPARLADLDCLLADMAGLFELPAPHQYHGLHAKRLTQAEPLSQALRDGHTLVRALARQVYLPGFPQGD